MPGTDASYSDTNFQLLGKIIEGITGKPLHAVYEDFFFRPLGLNHTWLMGRSEPRLRPSAAPADAFDKDMNITRTRANGAYAERDEDFSIGKGALEIESPEPRGPAYHPVTCGDIRSAAASGSVELHPRV